MKNIFFNSRKHHFHTMVQSVRAFCQQGITAKEKLIKEFYLEDSKGLIDVYHGSLQVNEIIDEVANFLTSNQLLDLASYKNYMETQGEIKRKGHYANLTLSDTSILTLRLIDDESQFVHIHPARYSPHTFRVKANTLKTVIFTYFLGECQNLPPDISIVNEARARLNLSPIPEIPSAIDEMLTRFQNFLPNP